jgi:hypothetical protein
VDLSKLTTSDKVIAGSGIVLFIASFLTWFKFTVSSSGGGVSFSRDLTFSGWDVGFLWGGLPALLGLLSAAIVIATKLGGTKMPDMPVTTGQAMLGAGGLAALLVIIKLLSGYHGIDRAFGLFIAVIAAIGLAVGGFLAYQEEQAGGASRA